MTAALVENPRRALRAATLAAAVAATLALAGCGAMVAQNPSSALKPVNAIAMDGDERVILAGHDVVAYWTLGRHAAGSPQFKSVYEGVTFRFANAEHKALFDAAPQKYLPQYGGYCANGIAYGIPWGGDADTWRIDNGRLFIFGGKGSKDAFELDVRRNAELADKYWKEEVQGSNSFFQRARRLVFRVPHYKSGEELAREVAAAQRK
jgi:YHS domain-containing protein